MLTKIGVKQESCIVFRQSPSAMMNRRCVYEVTWYIDLKDAPAHRPESSAEDAASIAATKDTGKGSAKKSKKKK